MTRSRTRVVGLRRVTAPLLRASCRVQLLGLGGAVTARAMTDLAPAWPGADVVRHGVGLLPFVVSVLLSLAAGSSALGVPTSAAPGRSPTVPTAAWWLVASWSACLVLLVRPDPRPEGVALVVDLLVAGLLALAGAGATVRGWRSFDATYGGSGEAGMLDGTPSARLVASTTRCSRTDELPRPSDALPASTLRFVRQEARLRRAWTQSAAAVTALAAAFALGQSLLWVASRGPGPWLAVPGGVLALVAVVGQPLLRRSEEYSRLAAGCTAHLAAKESPRRVRRPPSRAHRGERRRRRRVAGGR